MFWQRPPQCCRAVRHSVKPARCCVSSCSMVSDIRSSAGLQRRSPYSSHLTRPPVSRGSLPSQTCLSSRPRLSFLSPLLLLCPPVVISPRPLCLNICLLSFSFHLSVVSLKPVCLSLIFCLHLADEDVNMSFHWKQITLKMTHTRGCKL